MKNQQKFSGKTVEKREALDDVEVEDMEQLVAEAALSIRDRRR